MFKHNVNNIHWTTSSADRHGNISLYDSQYTRISNSLQQQLATIYRTDEKSIVVHVKPVQQQMGGSDCGLFSLAFAIDLASGVDPATISYNQSRMRLHLASCLAEKALRPFPRRKTEVRNRAPNIKLTVNVYCICRLPESFSKTMISCDHCVEWFHLRCVGLKRVKKTFFCPSCKPYR